MVEQNTVTERTLPAGYFVGLMGRDVKDETDKDLVVKTVFAAQPKGMVVVAYENVETLYPETEEAAIACAADCETNVSVLVTEKVKNEDGVEVSVQKIMNKKLTGVAAAVTIAKRLRVDESFRNRIRAGNTTELDLRRDALDTEGFELAGSGRAVKAAPVDAAALAAIFADPNATAEEKLAATTALLALSGVKVS